MKRRSDVEATIARVLEATTVPGSRNRFEAGELRELAVGYLNDYDEELARFPDLAGQAHWNLWMNDADLNDALFAVLIFRESGLEFFCGRGDAYAVKSFAESDFPDDPEDVLKEMRARFVVPHESVRVARQSAEEWLGRRIGGPA